jgi:uroporphyrinogen decarboxylase
MTTPLFSTPVRPDGEALVRCIRRQGTPDRVHYFELGLDREVQDEICARYSLPGPADPDDLSAHYRRYIALQRFLGYDYVRAGLLDVALPLKRDVAVDTAALQRDGGRRFQDEHVGPITSWEEFEAFQWPDPERDEVYRMFEWCEEHLPDDMCVMATGGFAHFNEHLSWLMGYETLCYALFDRRDLVRAISERLLAISEAAVRRVLQFGRVRLVFGTDDMGFRSATLISPDDLREFVLPNHRRIAALVHEAGHPYLLHCCGNLAQIMDDLIDDVGIDAKHSFEDTIEQVTEAKHTYGRRIALLGGIDVDFLCRASEVQIRERVRRTLDVCQPGGGYCLGTGNTVANYIPVDSYLAMMDEGRRYGA